METMNTFNLINHLYDLAVAHDCLRGFMCGALIGAKLGSMRMGEVCTVVMGDSTSRVYNGIIQKRELCDSETVAIMVSKMRNADMFAVCRIK